MISDLRDHYKQTMSLELKQLLTKDDTVLARVTGGVADGQFLVVSSVPGTHRVDLPINSHFNLEPTHCKSQRQLFSCAAVSGAGKSTLAKSFCERYHVLWSDRNVILISKLGSDATLDAATFIKRIDVESLVTAPLSLEELSSKSKGCLIVFDDVEGLKKPSELSVQALSDLIATQGRHFQISALYLSHNVSNGMKSRTVLNEVHGMILFAHGSSFSQTKTALQTYCGLSPKEVRDVRNLPSRWVCLYKRYPPCVIADGCAYLVSST